LFRCWVVLTKERTEYEDALARTRDVPLLGEEAKTAQNNVGSTDPPRSSKTMTVRSIKNYFFTYWNQECRGYDRWPKVQFMLFFFSHFVSIRFEFILHISKSH